MTIVIGLTGSIATGKSTISQMFYKFDIPVIDADQLSREVVEPGKKAYQQIISVFGEEILDKDRTLDRKRLGKVIFADEMKRQQLNEIVHPEVRNEMIRQRDHFKHQQKRAVVLDIPLLFESKLTSYVDRTLVVYVDEEVQLNRLMERDQSNRTDAEQRIQSQLSIGEKAELADAVIDNNGSIEESFQQLTDILHKWNIV